MSMSNVSPPARNGCASGAAINMPDPSMSTCCLGPVITANTASAGAPMRRVRVSRSSGIGTSQEEGARRHSTTSPHRRDVGIRHLPVAGVAAQLQHRLVQEAIAMSTAAGQLSAMRVERQLAVERDPLASLEKVLGLADAAEPERFQP